jgi:HK97 family phage prohead protease
MSNQVRFPLSSEVRAAQDGDQMTLVGRAVTYGALSSDLGGFREVVQAGAFAQSLRTENVIMDFNHNDRTAIPLGTTDAGTLILTDGQFGLDFRCKLDPNQEAHRSLYSSVKRGDVSKCSWAFNVDGRDGEEFRVARDEKGISYNQRVVKRAHLYGISAVMRPAYPGDATRIDARSIDARRKVNGVKSFEQQFVDANGYDPWLEKIRAMRFALELRSASRRESKDYQRELKDQIQKERTAEEARWAADPEFTAWKNSAEPVRWRRC